MEFCPSFVALEGRALTSLLKKRRPCEAQTVPTTRLGRRAKKGQKIKAQRLKVQGFKQFSTSTKSQCDVVSVLGFSSLLFYLTLTALTWENRKGVLCVCGDEEKYQAVFSGQDLLRLSC